MSLKIVPWISPSALAAFSGCKQQWKWSYVDGYRFMGRNFALDVGSGVHVGLADFYRNETDPREAFREWVDAEVEKTQGFMDVGGEDIEKALQSDLDSLEDVRKLGNMMLKSYLKWFAAESLEVLAVEQRLERPIPGTDWTLPLLSTLWSETMRRRAAFMCWNTRPSVGLRSGTCTKTSSSWQKPGWLRSWWMSPLPALFTTVCANRTTRRSIAREPTRLNGGLYRLIVHRSSSC